MWITRNSRYTSSRGLAAACSPTSSAARRCRCAQSRSSNIRKASLRCASPDCRFGMTCGRSEAITRTALKCSDVCVPSPPTLSLPEDFRARISRALAEARAFAAREAGSGRSMRALFARYDRATCSWRIPHAFALEGLDEFSETWPRFGMMRHGACCRLRPWAPGICAKGSGSRLVYPTPTVNGNYNRKGISPKAGDGLATAVKTIDRFPTPRCVDAKTPWHGKGTPSLSCVVTNYPTPNTHLMCGGSGAYSQIVANANLTDEEKRVFVSGNGARLNADWVEWLMCWPVGWTDVKTPTERLRWMHPTADPSDRPRDDESFVARLTSVREKSAARIKCIGNGQYPPTALVAFAYGLAVLNLNHENLETRQKETR